MTTTRHTLGQQYQMTTLEPDVALTEAQTAAAIVGAPVYTRDGRCLGTVKETGERCFLVDARFAFDYWLSIRTVAAVSDSRVLLGVDKRDVGDYLVDPDCLQDFEDLDPVTDQVRVPALRPATP